MGLPGATSGEGYRQSRRACLGDPTEKLTTYEGGRTVVIRQHWQIPAPDILIFPSKSP